MTGSQHSRRLTVVVVARNAAATIGRALRSALAEPADAVLLVDDRSEDSTIEEARACGDRRLRIVRLTDHTTVGHARQSALAHVTTPMGMWLDADDELLPGRVDRMRTALVRDDADLATDSAELVTAEGSTRPLPLPGFLWRAPGIVRVFERNYLPAPGPIAFRTERLGQLGYDITLHGAEDIDLLLRALASSFRVALVAEAGYRVHALPHSLSRDPARQRSMYRRALRKFSYEAIECLWRAAAATQRQTVWGLHSTALFRNDLLMAGRLLGRLQDMAFDPLEVTDPSGPCSKPEGWRLAFARGTLSLLSSDWHAAVEHLRAAERYTETAESANNLGVALAGRGDWPQAAGAFEVALARFPGYADAYQNLVRQAPPWAITTHALREQAARSDYPLAVPMAG